MKGIKMEEMAGGSGDQKNEDMALVVELFCDAKIDLGSLPLLVYLRKYCGTAESDDGAAPDNPRFLVSSPDNHDLRIKLGLSTASFTKENVLDYASSFRQSWSWRTAKEVVQACTGVIIVREEYDGKTDYKGRVHAMQSAVRAILECTSCRAAHFQMTQQFIRPEGYLASFADHNQERLFGFINVRFFRIQSSDDMLMDTIGLNFLGLEDLQCSFKKYNPKDISAVLLNTAYYLFDNGNIIMDDDTVQGLKRTDKWACHRTQSLVAPKRTVIEISPGLFK